MFDGGEGVAQIRQQGPLELAQLERRGLARTTSDEQAEALHRISRVAQAGEISGSPSLALIVAPNPRYACKLCSVRRSSPRLTGSGSGSAKSMPSSWRFTSRMAASLGSWSLPMKLAMESTAPTDGRARSFGSSSRASAIESTITEPNRTDRLSLAISLCS